MTLRSAVHRHLGGDPTGDGRIGALNCLIVTAILAAITLNIISTEPDLARDHLKAFEMADIGFGAFFAAEYLLRIWTAPESAPALSAGGSRIRFAFSPLGLLDLVVVVGSLAPIFLPGIAVLRMLRLARLLLIVRLGRFSSSFRELTDAIFDRRYELFVTLALAAMLLVLGATALYMAEGSVQPEKFGSIPRSLWWSIITLTTVGYGDVSPITPLGKVLASIVALAGIGLVAMPTGIVAAAFSDAMQERRRRQSSMGTDNEAS